MTTTKEFLKEIKEQDIDTHQVEIQAIGLGLNKFVDSRNLLCLLIFTSDTFETFISNLSKSYCF